MMHALILTTCLGPSTYVPYVKNNNDKCIIIIIILQLILHDLSISLNMHALIKLACSDSIISGHGRHSGKL